MDGEWKLLTGTVGLLVLVAVLIQIFVPGGVMGTFGILGK